MNGLCCACKSHNLNFSVSEQLNSTIAAKICSISTLDSFKIVFILSMNQNMFSWKHTWHLKLLATVFIDFEFIRVYYTSTVWIPCLLQLLLLFYIVYMVITTKCNHLGMIVYKFLLNIYTHVYNSCIWVFKRYSVSHTYIRSHTSKYCVYLSFLISFIL